MVTNWNFRKIFVKLLEVPSTIVPHLKKYFYCKNVKSSTKNGISRLLHSRIQSPLTNNFYSSKIQTSLTYSFRFTQFWLSSAYKLLIQQTVVVFTLSTYEYRVYWSLFWQILKVNAFLGLGLLAEVVLNLKSALILRMLNWALNYTTFLKCV